MKNTIITQISILILLVLISCKKDDQNNNYLNATVNGQDYKSIRVNAHFPASSNKKILSISSSADGGRTITLAINAYNGLGTYNFKSDNRGSKNLATYSYMRESDKFSVIYTTEDADNNGSITITKEEGNVVQGTFTFKALDFNNEYVTVNNGRFSTFFS